MKVKVKKLCEGAVMPRKGHKEDFCYDVTAISAEEIAPDVWKYRLGLAFEMERLDEEEDIRLAIHFYPRSSVWKTGMVLSNSVGTIDEGYRGEVSAIFYHVMKDMPRYEIGDRIGQICISAGPDIEFEFVDELSDTDRGEGGFGSTGR